MTITTDQGIKINTTETPHWNEYHQRFYAWGFRWIKTKQTYSTSKTLHNFKTFKEVGE